MRYPVEMILDLLSSGMTFAEIMEDYPAIEESDMLACLAFAPKLTKVKNRHTSAVVGARSAVEETCRQV
jgi:uncharacterized protein (DUF433 family)